MSRDFDYWRKLTLSAVRLRDPADADAIARACVAAGENASVWHEAARFYGTPCPCLRCERIG